ncbi:uncharacterized protein LOC124289574 [Haliotis rubra]|uniref:uncharacterized protein LOC124289574 n=1 Tax=Haliotis rubra TaxID=36100 RepID=UPI001EE5F5F1|nr:uncharacterized protein LOC124289574 [Haliotis rubra]
MSRQEFALICKLGTMMTVPKGNNIRIRRESHPDLALPNPTGGLDKDTYLATAFHYILGKDISHKLYQIQELLLSSPDYMRTLASRQSSMVNSEEQPGHTGLLP